ncbi:hypothetical protein EDD96_2316 [Streptomyces sp. Ag109_G2-6]|uniref:DUF7439 family protein n=1 Tax=Streptomyces sp. Ag109_G2-6 TaxID=2485154 RepID=UPI000F4FA1FD|nr:hypothetical protein [Streptomyces sp. Ag109_G2-6]RPF45752.1 hypothetical protein EDD96_2316 [Streptomyces sp. Ag109_G2-6]
MSKHRKPVAAVLSALPVRYRSRAGAVVAALGVIVSIAATVYADRPEVALIVQVATALGLVEGRDSE